MWRMRARMPSQETRQQSIGRGGTLVPCRYCGSTHTVKYGHAHGGSRKQRYLCRTCQRYFREPPGAKNHIVLCMYCGSDQTCKHGYIGDGRRRFYCHACQRTFTEGTRRRWMRITTKICLECRQIYTPSISRRNRGKYCKPCAKTVNTRTLLAFQQSARNCRLRRASALKRLREHGRNGGIELLNGRWSKSHACCVACGTTTRSHAGNGYCKVCYDKQRYAARFAQTLAFYQQFAMQNTER